MNDYLELLKVGLIGAIGYAFIGCLLGIGLVIFLHKRGFLKRELRLLKYLTKLYFIFIPSVFFVFFWLAGSIWTSLKAYENAIAVVVTEIEEEVHIQFIDFMDKRVDTFLADNNIPSNETIVALFMAVDTKDGVSSVYRHTMKIALTTLLEYTIGENSERSKRIKNLSEGIGERLISKGFNFLKKEVKTRINQMFVLLLIPIVIAFLGAVFFPLAEIFISVVFKQHSRKKPMI